jgi:hypothetical protein
MEYKSNYRGWNGVGVSRTRCRAMSVPSLALAAVAEQVWLPSPHLRGEGHLALRKPELGPGADASTSSGSRKRICSAQISALRDTWHLKWVRSAKLQLLICAHAVTFAVVVDNKRPALPACGARSPDLRIVAGCRAAVRSPGSQSGRQRHHTGAHDRLALPAQGLRCSRAGRARRSHWSQKKPSGPLHAPSPRVGGHEPPDRRGGRGGVAVGAVPLGGKGTAV